jgi:hypothetical protein
MDYFSYIVAVSFIGGGNQSAQRKPLTCRKSLTHFITYCCIEYTSPDRDISIIKEIRMQYNCQILYLSTPGDFT